MKQATFLKADSKLRTVPYAVW